MASYNVHRYLKCNVTNMSVGRYCDGETHNMTDFVNEGKPFFGLGFLWNQNVHTFSGFS